MKKTAVFCITIVCMFTVVSCFKFPNYLKTYDWAIYGKYHNDFMRYMAENFNADNTKTSLEERFEYIAGYNYDYCNTPSVNLRLSDFSVIQNNSIFLTRYSQLIDSLYTRKDGNIPINILLDSLNTIEVVDEFEYNKLKELTLLARRNIDGLITQEELVASFNTIKSEWISQGYEVGGDYGFAVGACLSISDSAFTWWGNNINVNSAAGYQNSKLCGIALSGILYGVAEGCLLYRITNNGSAIYQYSLICGFLASQGAMDDIYVYMKNQ